MPARPDVTRATLRDLDALLELEEACYLPGQAFSRHEYRYMLGEANSENLKAVARGRIVGFVGAFVHEGWRLGNIYTLNVAPEARRRGLGGELLAAIEARLAARGMTRAALEVNAANGAAIALYEGAGYVRVERLRGYYPAYADPDGWRYAKALPPVAPRAARPR